MPSLTGNKPNQVPLNADLGNLAYQNASSIAGPVTVGGSVTANGVVSDTISEKTSAAGVTIDSVLLKDGLVGIGADGSASAPSIYRASDTNTGVFFPATDTVAIAAGGVESARVVSGLLSIPANSTAASAVRLYEDTDNGTNYVDIIAPSAITSDRTLTIPDASGTIDRLNRAGNVLQVVQHTFSNVQTSTSSASYVDTDVTGSITPTSATSKILVIVSSQSMAAASSNGAAALKRGASTVVADGILWFTAGSNSNIWFPASFSYLDSPATTSSTTYTVQIKVDAGTQARFGWGTTSVSTLILMEIAA
jgi:hypothetical protein